MRTSVLPRWTAGLLCHGVLVFDGCGDRAVKAVPPTVTPTSFVLTINSAAPASGVGVSISPADLNGNGEGTTSFSRTYAVGSVVTVTVAPAAQGNSFSSWAGCPAAKANVCTLTLNANTTLMATYALPAPPTFSLTVDSTNPSSGVAIGLSPVDNNGLSGGSTFFSRLYNQGAQVTVTAPETVGISSFRSWGGCDRVIALLCSVSMNSNATVTANYVANAVTGVTVSPASASVLLGASQQLAATVTGSGRFSNAVRWSLAGPAGYTGDLGTIDPTGFTSRRSLRRPP